MPEARGQAGVRDNKVTRMAAKAGVEDNKVTRMAAKAGVRDNKVEYFYFVSVMYPFREQSLENANKTMEVGFRYEQPEGRFKLIVTTDKELVFAFHFKNSEAANKAKSLDFSGVREMEVETEVILPELKVNDFHYFLVTELRFMLLTENDYDVAVEARVEAVKARIEAGFNARIEAGVKAGIEAAIEAGIETRVQAGIEAGVKAGIEAATTTPPLEAATVVEQPLQEAECLEEGAKVIKKQRLIRSEMACNDILQDVLSAKLEEFGFECVGNSALSHVPMSKYFNSRPDLVIYHREKLLAATAVIDNETNDEEDTLMGAATNDEDDTLMGVVTENKKNSATVEAQLLAGMEKVAGELIYKHFRKKSGEVVNKIEIYGLIITYPDTFKVHLLKMDFVSNSCCVHVGREPLTMADGFNRLVTQLKRRLQCE